MAVQQIGSPAGVRIELLSEPAIGRDDQRVALSWPRAGVVLARLALAQGRVVAREALAEAVWGEELPRSWRAALRNVVAEVRGAFARLHVTDALQTVGDGYRLELPAGSDIDLTRLERDAEAAVRALRERQPLRALELALPALELTAAQVLPGARGEWVETLRRRVGDLRDTLAPAAAQAALELGRYREAEQLAQVAIETSPWQEASHRVLIEALARDGKRTAAVAAYGRLRELLERELGISPSPETERMRRELLAKGSPPAEPLGSAPAIAPWRRSADYGLRVARMAFAAGEYDDVVAIAQRARQALDAAGNPDPVRRLDLLILLAGAQQALGREEAFTSLQTALELAGELEDGERLADALLTFTHLGAVTDEHYVDHGLTKRYQQALAALPGPDPGRRARLLGHLAVAYAHATGGRRVQTAADEAIEFARGAENERTLLEVLMLARRAVWGRYQLDRQARLEEEILALAARLEDPAAQASALLWQFMTRIEQGEGLELERLLDTAEDGIMGLHMGHYHHTLAYSRAALTILRGDLQEGEELIGRAAEIGHRRGISVHITEGLRLAQLTALYHEQGRIEEIREPAIRLYGSAGQPLWLGMVAIIEAETGRPEAAAAPLAEFIRTYRRRGPTLLAPVAIAAFTSVAIARLVDVDHANLLYELTAPHAGRGSYFGYFAGPTDLFLGLLTEALGQPVQARRHYEDAAAFCGRLGAPLWTQRCLAHAQQVN